MRVGFLYITQFHQILHSLPTALELSILRPDFKVEIWGATAGHLEFIQRLVPLYPGAKVEYHLLRQPWPLRLYQRYAIQNVPPKVVTLFHNRRRLNELDALVVPDKTSLILRRMGCTHPLFINTEHGAGDRDVTFDPRVAKFDFNLLPSPKTAARLLADGYLKPDQYAVGAYAKFDIVRRMHAGRPPLFANGRPTVLYNPHFLQRLSSWHRWGCDVLRAFAAQDRYNLVFAPHVRLFDPPTPAKLADFQSFAEVPHLMIDLGSERSVDMSYTLGADLYLGDVSSQVYEFLMQPRPCLFLNAHGVDWQPDSCYAFWKLGPVLDDVAGLMAGVDEAFARHRDFLPIQRQALAANFDLSIADPGRHNAALLADYLLSRK